MDTFTPRAIQTEFYGDVYRWWIGVVVNINDPLQSGRVRVRIYGVHNEDINLVPEADLPWAIPILPTTEDGISGLGRSSKLKPGAMVTGYFADGPQSQIPIILGSVPRFASPTPGQLGDGNRFNSSSFVPSVETPLGDNDSKQAQGSQGQMYSTAAAVGKTNTEKTFNFLMSTTLFTPMHASAIIANMLLQSNLDPSKVYGLKGQEQYGICLWHPVLGRVARLKEFAVDRSLEVSKLETQLLYFMYDFTEYAPRLYKLNQFIATGDLAKATEAFAIHYLRPQNPFGDIQTRIKYAKNVYEAYNVA